MLTNIRVPLYLQYVYKVLYLVEHWQKEVSMIIWGELGALWRALQGRWPRSVRASLDLPSVAPRFTPCRKKFIHIQIWTWAISSFCTFLREEVTINSQYKTSHFLEIPTIKMGFCKFGYCSCPLSQHYLHKQPDNGDDDGDEGGRVDPAGQLPLRRRRISFSRRRISRPQACPCSRSHQVWSSPQPATDQLSFDQKKSFKNHSWTPHALHPSTLLDHDWPPLHLPEPDLHLLRAHLTSCTLALLTLHLCLLPAFA